MKDAAVEGDLLALHTHQTWPADEEYVTMGFFRFDADGEIIEYWDAMQEVPHKTHTAIQFTEFAPNHALGRPKQWSGAIDASVQRGT